MHRGSTPTFRFEVEIKKDDGSVADLSGLTALSIVFSQNNKVVIEKRLSDCVIEKNVIDVYLTEEETLLFKTDEMENAYIDIQLKFGFDNKRVISDIIQVIVKPILKDGVLNAM